MEINLRVWRQKNQETPGEMVEYKVAGVNPHMSFLEMLDVANEQLLERGMDPIAFDHDCREGICGACSLMIDGVAHGPESEITTCQLHMRHFEDGDTVTVEPWRARAFPVIKDLVVDRSAFDRIVQKGGFISVSTGAASEANHQLIAKKDAERAMDAAACIGCGACVAACKNASAMLFVAAKVSHLSLLPQGQPERQQRVWEMTEQMRDEGFGDCTNQYECQAVCPKNISVVFIARMNREYLRSSLRDHQK